MFLLALPASAQPALKQSSMRTITIRLRPGQDLKVELQRLVEREKLQAGFILTAVGSVTTLSLRLANQSAASQFQGPFEIVSLVGTLSPDGLHLHMAASDKEGKTLGGHLVDGNLIHTTAEIVIGVPHDVKYRRTLDPATGYPELAP